MMYDSRPPVDGAIPPRPVKVRSGRRTRSTCPACEATTRRSWCSQHDPDQVARAAAHAARVKAHVARVHATDTPGTRSAERDLLADGLEDLARVLRANGQLGEADALEEKAERTRWAVRP